MSIVSGKLGGNISVTGSGIQQGYASLLLSYNFFAKYDEDGREVPLLTLKDQVITTTVDGVGDLKDVEIIIPKTVVMDGDIEFTLEGSFTFDAVKQSVALTKNSLKLTAVDKDSSRDFTDEFSYTLKSSDFVIVDSEGNAITDFEIGQTEVEVVIDGELGREVTVSYKVGEIYINGTKMSDEVEGVSTTVADLNGKLIQNIVIPYKVIIDEYTGLEGNINITTSNEVDAYFTATFKVFDDYDITTVKGWIPDARQWNDDVAVPEKIDVLSISNGTYTYTVGGKQAVGKIENENLVTGDRLMNNMYNLKTVNCNFPKLKCGLQMFSNCGNLTTVNTDLASVETGRDLFFMCISLNTISLTNLDELINGSRMFQGCKKITNFSYDLPNLKSGRGMFEGCSSLTNFSGSLGNLLSGNNMFTGCKLNKQSVLNIAESIKDISQLVKEDDSQWQIWSYWYETKQYSDTPELQYRGVINIDTADDVTLDDAEVVEALNSMTDTKGWTVYFNSEVYVPNIPDYNISEENGYVPNADKWNEEVFVPNNLIITRIINGELLNDE